jgi:hypothetical protein
MQSKAKHLFFPSFLIPLCHPEPLCHSELAEESFLSTPLCHAERSEASFLSSFPSVIPSPSLSFRACHESFLLNPASFYFGNPANEASVDIGPPWEVRYRREIRLGLSGKSGAEKPIAVVCFCRIAGFLFCRIGNAFRQSGKRISGRYSP